MWRLAAVSLTGLLVAGCPGKEPPGDDAAARKAKAEIDAFGKRLGSLREKTSVPSDELDEHCPDDELEKRTGGAPAPLLVADYDYVEWFARPAGDPYAGARAGWQLLTAPALRNVVPSERIAGDKTANDVLFAIKKLDETYDWVGVLRTRERRLPRRDGDKFHGGKLDGWLVVFELATGNAVCRARVEAESSAEVAGITGSDPEQLLRNDFYRQVREAIGAAVQRISRILREDLG